MVKTVLIGFVHLFFAAVYFYIFCWAVIIVGPVIPFIILVMVIVAGIIKASSEEEK